MKPIFPRFNMAVRNTLEYYEKEMIEDYMKKLAGEPNLTYLDRYIEDVYNYHKYMEDEIQQTIHTTNHNTQVELFELLKSWETDWRIRVVNAQLIERQIDEMNEEKYDRFLKRVEDAEDKFFAADPYRMKHKETYQTEEKNPLFFGTTYTVTRTNYHYYCIEEKSYQIDTKYLPNYLGIVTPIVENFRNIITKYTQRYDRGLILPNSTIVSIKNEIKENQETPKQIEAAKPVGNPKIKVNVTAGQLLAFFRLLYDIEPAIFNVQDQAELRTFIINNFITRQTRGTSMNEKKTANQFSSPDAKDVKHWISILKKLGDNAAKY